jgi:hypothetical protein
LYGCLLYDIVCCIILFVVSYCLLYHIIFCIILFVVSYSLLFSLVAKAFRQCSIVEFITCPSAKLCSATKVLTWRSWGRSLLARYRLYGGWLKKSHSCTVRTTVWAHKYHATTRNLKSEGHNPYPFKGLVKSLIPSAGIIRSSPYSPR